MTKIDIFLRSIILDKTGKKIQFKNKTNEIMIKKKHKENSFQELEE